MKRTLLLMLCLATILLPLFNPALAEWEPERPATIQTSKAGANVYAYSYPFKNVIDTLENGTVVDLIQFSPDGKYYRVSYDDGLKAGWVRCDQLGFSKKK